MTLCFTVYAHRLRNKWFAYIACIFYAVWFSGSVHTTISDIRVCSEGAVCELYFSSV